MVYDGTDYALGTPMHIIVDDDNFRVGGEQRVYFPGLKSLYGDTVPPEVWSNGRWGVSCGNTLFVYYDHQELYHHLP
jgi:hypothetical protein